MLFQNRMSGRKLPDRCPQPTGCAKGSFLRAMAAEKPEWNYLGLEIRRPTAATALERAARLGTRNCHVVCCNANVRF